MRTSRFHSVAPVIAILLVIAIHSTSFVQLGVMAWFEFNHETIAKELCEKKDVEGNCCQGSCVLKKQLEKTSEPESLPGLPEILVRVSFQFVFVTEAATLLLENSRKPLYPPSRYTFSIITHDGSDIFEPPRRGGSQRDQSLV